MDLGEHKVQPGRQDLPRMYGDAGCRSILPEWAVLTSEGTGLAKRGCRLLD